MQNENIRLSSEVIEIAEHKTFLELTSRICYYDDVNANNMMLPYDDTSEIRAQTLVNMPVQAKYRKNYKNEGTFGGHEMFKDANGNVIFNTSSIGTHVEVYIKEDTVMTVSGVQKTLPCLFAKYRIWKRYKNVVEAAQRLFNLKKLFSSWEILTSAYEFKDGIKKIVEYEFEANTLLGFEYSTPSYGSSACALSLASVEENEMLIAEALSQDLIDESLNIENTEGGSQETMSKTKENDVSEIIVETNKVTTDTGEVTQEVATASVENTEGVIKTDVSELTDYDLRKKISEECRKKLSQYCYIAFHFPVISEIWVEQESRESELDYVKFTYSVVNDVVTLSEPEKVKLQVGIAEINSTLIDLESQIATKEDALVKAGNKISELSSEISELVPFKEKFEIAEQEKIQAEQEAKKVALIDMATKTNLITKEEIEASEELKGFIESLDEKAIKTVIADKLIASLNSDTKHETATTESVKIVSTSVNLNNLEDTVQDTKSIMKNFLGGNK